MGFKFKNTNNKLLVVAGFLLPVAGCLCLAGYTYHLSRAVERIHQEKNELASANRKQSEEIKKLLKDSDELIKKAPIAHFQTKGCSLGVPHSKMYEEECILYKMGQIADLPKDDTPSFAKISDESLTGNVPFLKNGKNGDYLVIFPKSQKAFLYRESENRMINTGPVSTQNGVK